MRTQSSLPGKGAQGFILFSADMHLIKRLLRRRAAAKAECRAGPEVKRRNAAVESRTRPFGRDAQIVTHSRTAAICLPFNQQNALPKETIALGPRVVDRSDAASRVRSGLLGNGTALCCQIGQIFKKAPASHRRIASRHTHRVERRVAFQKRREGRANGGAQARRPGRGSSRNIPSVPSAGAGRAYPFGVALDRALGVHCVCAPEPEQSVDKFVAPSVASLLAKHREQAVDLGRDPSAILPVVNAPSM